MTVSRQAVMDCAMGLPAASHVVQWGDSDVFKVGGKVFAICGDDGFSFKVTEIGFMALTEGGPARQAPYLAKGQWVFVPLDDASDDDLAGWLATSHGLIAEKLTRKLRAELGL
jgi:predicted DNA-binding protein (MmcQ/YjbR family)